MGSRERKRAARRKRKQRGARRAAEIDAGARAASHDGDAVSVEELAARAEREGVSRSELKDRAAREKLEPLAHEERPLVVTVGAVISGLITLSIVGAYVAGATVEGERPPLLQVIAPALLMGVMAYGMWRARYWAVLGFQAVMALLMVGAVLSLIQATEALQIVVPVVVLVAAAALFYFTIKALARIQMPSRLPRE